MRVEDQKAIDHAIRVCRNELAKLLTRKERRMVVEVLMAETADLICPDAYEADLAARAAACAVLGKKDGDA